MAVLLATMQAFAAGSKDGKVGYTELHNYFHNNDAPIPASPLITTQKEFDAQFGMAAFMGKDGQPTPVNFRRQAVLAIVLPVTDEQTTIDSVSVTATGEDTLTLAYSVHRGYRMGYSTQPIRLIAVDKKYRKYAVRVARAEHHDVSVSESGYQVVTVSDRRHNLDITADFPSGGGKGAKAVRDWMAARLQAMGKYFSLGPNPAGIAFSPAGNADGKDFVQGFAIELADSMEAVDRASGIYGSDRRCSLTATLTRVWETPRYVSYEATGYAYMGGAHGLGFCDGVTIDKATGRRLTLVTGAPGLQKLLTERLHKNVEVPHFESEPVPMPQADPYVVAGGKIKFVYQPYEIGPYAIGMPDCELYPYELEDWLTTDGKAVAGM